jgi:hypothetical protein
VSHYANAPTDENPEDPGMVGIDDHVEGRESPDNYDVDGKVD